MGELFQHPVLFVIAAAMVGTVAYANWAYWTERWHMTPEERKQADREFDEDI
jgi:hypothetical protein